MKLPHLNLRTKRNSSIVILPFDAIRARKSFLDEREISSNLAASDLLPAVTHELKTPISAIISFAENLRENFRDPKSVLECEDSISEIISVANEMNELVHDLLDVGQISSGNFSVDLSQNISISEVIKRSVRMNKDYAMRRNISLKTEISAEAMKSIKLDAKRMKQILTNLISNAVKYSKAQTEIKIICKIFSPHPTLLAENDHSGHFLDAQSPHGERELEKNFLEISVIDQGFGMTAEQLKTAFEKYKTFANENSETVDSFGLGLPIVKQLVELQNGSIEAISEVGKGTEMRIRFPI